MKAGRAWASALAALAAVTAGGAVAQVRIDPRAQPLAGDELQACLDQRDTLAQDRRRLDGARAAHNAEAAALADEGRVLAAALRALDTQNLAAVEAHNARNAERNLRVERLNARVAVLEADAARLQAAEADYRQRCTRRGFRAPPAPSAPKGSP